MLKRLLGLDKEPQKIDFSCIQPPKLPTPRAHFGRAVAAVNQRIEELAKEASLEELKKIAGVLERIDKLSTNAYTTYHLASGESFII